MQLKSGRLNFPKTWDYQFWVLFALALVYLVLGLGAIPLADWDENVYAEASRQMLLSQDYINITVNAYPYNEKPPLFYWFQVGSYKLFGVSAGSARLASALFGVLYFLLFYQTGKRIKNAQLGLLWAVIFLTSFIPTFLAKGAFIDHCFNFWITASTCCLFYYEHTQALAKKRFFLVLASFFAGLAMLTKGPLGLAIPAVSFLGYCILVKRRLPAFQDWLIAAPVVVITAFSWIFALAWSQQGDFLKDFLQFQWEMASQSWEGHSGPFYYHWLIIWVGLAPWSGFLLCCQYQKIGKYWLNFGLVWVLFVLVVMSVVQNKLPHYSASVYTPLSLAVAFGLQQCISNWRLWFGTGFYTITGLAYIGFVAASPWWLNMYGQTEGLNIQYDLPLTAWWLLGLAVLGLGAGAWCLLQKKTFLAMVFTLLFMLVNTQNLLRFPATVYLEHSQQNLVSLTHQFQQKPGRLVFYRIVSHAAIFQGAKPIEMLHTRYENEPNLLAQRQAQDVYIISLSRRQTQLLEEYPLVEALEKHFQYSVLILKKNPDNP